MTTYIFAAAVSFGVALKASLAVANRGVEHGGEPMLEQPE